MLFFLTWIGISSHASFRYYLVVDLYNSPNLWWRPNSVSKGFWTSLKTGSSRRYHHNPQRLWHNLFVHIARTHGMAKNLADWARHSSWIGELHRYNITVISLYILQATPVCCGDVVKKACCIATHTSGGPVLFSYWTAKKLQIWKDFWSLAFCVIFVGWSKHIIITY